MGRLFAISSTVYFGCGFGLGPRIRGSGKTTCGAFCAYHRDYSAGEQQSLIFIRKQSVFDCTFYLMDVGSVYSIYSVCLEENFAGTCKNNS